MKSTILKKKKGKEKVLKPNEESLEHIDFHLFSKSNGDVHSLILFWMDHKGEKGASMP
jgi:hypothetical protein